MIKKLEGILETIDYENLSLFLIHHNKEADDYPKHWHSAIEIIMPVKNGYNVSVNECSYRLEEFDILIIPIGEIHEVYPFKNPEDDKKINGERIIIQFDFALFKNVKGLNNVSYIFFKPWLITQSKMPELHKIFKVLLFEILSEWENKKDCYEAGIIAKLINLAVHMVRENKLNPDTVFLENNVKRKTHIINFNRCIEYINQHYKEDLPLEYISSIAGFSKYHFTRWFKQFAGISFYEYLTQVRVKVAESMLVNSEAPITEVALESGFQSIATFNRVFKSNKNLTPTEFRDLQQMKNYRL